MTEPLASLSRSVAEQVVVITGAASGMGRSTARLFAAEGARVAVLDRDGDGAATVAHDIRAAGATAQAWALDVADRTAISTVVAEVEAALGPIDVLVNNAGVALPSPLGAAGEGFDAAWDATVAINLSAHAFLARACLGSLQRNRAGHIVNVASTEGWGATPGLAAYTATKHGVIGLTRAMAVELGRTGVTANCVCPGPIRTAMTAEIPDEAKDTFARRRVALARYGDPEEVAHAVLSLALPASSFINGAVLVVDGGMLAKNA